MDLFGLIQGTGEKLVRGSGEANPGAINHLSEQQIPDAPGGFRQFLQHFLGAHTSGLEEENLNLANLNLLNIGIDPAADFADEMMSQQFQDLANRVTESAPQAGLGNNLPLHFANFPDLEQFEKYILTLRELSDIVSMAKNSSAEAALSEEMLQELATSLMPILTQLETNTEVASTHENERIPTEEQVPKSNNNPVSDAQTQIGASSETKLHVRPVLAVSKMDGDRDMPNKLISALQVVTKDAEFLLSFDDLNQARDVEIAGLPVDKTENENVLQITLPENLKTFPVSLESTTLIESDTVEDELVEATEVLADKNNSYTPDLQSDDVPLHIVEKSADMPTPVDQHVVSETELRHVPVDGAGTVLPAREGKPETPPTQPFEHTQTTTGKQETLPLFNKATTEEPTPELITKVPVPEQEISFADSSAESLINRLSANQTVENEPALKMPLPQVLTMRILKVKTENSQHDGKHPWYKTENIDLPEESEQQLARLGKIIHKTASTWQQTLNDALQKHTEVELEEESGKSKESSGLMKHAVKNYTDSETNTTPKNAEQVSHGAEPETLLKENLASDKTSARTQNAHPFKTAAPTKSAMSSQIERVQSFANIRSQIAPAIRNGESEIHIQLKPENLGSIRLMMTLKDGLLNANFLVESTEVKSLLEKNLDSLRETLAERGIKAEHVEVQAQQQIVQSSKAENQEQRSARQSQDDRRDNQQNRQQKQQNREDRQQKRFDQYL
ncbi:MAG: flagellar hook-length control protein FliK [Deferribacteres bacterium]|nr:flagellar hook-length control protein FliK [Deferribacteres bacterium]